MKLKCFHGTWSSIYCNKVKLALKLVGIPYKYKENGLKNKSQLLLYDNLVHKNVLVIVHSDYHIIESLVILEYIEEKWNHNPNLLPEDPC